MREIIIVILGFIAAVFDLRVKRIPNALNIAIISAWAITITVMLLMDIETAVMTLKDSLFGLMFGGGLFLLVYTISQRGLGGGDVKFMAGAGLCLGYNGTVAAMFCGTLLAAITGLILVILKKINRKDKIPLAPFLYVGILIAVINPT